MVGDNLGQFYGEVVFAIAPSKIQKGLIWAGTNDGQVWYTKDGTANWVNVTKNITGLPAWGTVTSIAPSVFDASTAYVSIDFHLVDNRDPFIYKTTDMGKTWKLISGSLPKDQLSYVRNVSEDPNVAGLLFAGTGNALYYSLNDGESWTALQTGLPHAPVTWTVVQKGFHDLVVSTYGRGLYILDDISPLEQMAKSRSDTAAVLYQPRNAYRFVWSPQTPITYSLKAATKDPVEIEILDAQERTVRTLEGPGKAGFNRVKWDMRYDSPRVIALRTKAPDNPHIWEEPRFRDADSRPITHWGSKPAEVGPIVAPGKYTVRIKVDGQTQSQPLTVVRDPRSPGSDADIGQSVTTLLRIRDDISRTSDTVNNIEWLRKQLEVIEAMLRPPKKAEANKEAPSNDSDEDREPKVAPAPPKPLTDAQKKHREGLLKAAEELDGKLLAIEHRLVSQALLNSDDKYFVEPYQVYLNLMWLNAEVGTGGGDVAGSANFAPTQTQMGLLQDYESELSTVETDYQKLLKEALPAFNRALENSNLGPLVAGL
jgi:hypothetical protein